MSQAAGLRIGVWMPQALSQVGVEGSGRRCWGWYPAPAGAVQNPLGGFSMNKVIQGPVKGQADGLHG